MMLALWLALMPATDCTFDCTDETFQLQIDGKPVDAGNLTKDQCGELAQELDPQTPPFTKFECVELRTKQQDL